MDFSYLLELAQTNDKTNKKEAAKKKFTTNLSGSKKQEKTVVDTDAIKRRLDEKEEKKRQEQKAFQAKKDKLLELRSHDKKANKRVIAMINRTKGASKAVLDDAKNLTGDKAEPQCDADDYGYESTMSAQIFAKLTDTYKYIPDDERLKFKKTSAKDMQDIKSRVMNSLKRQEEEDMIPGRKKRKMKNKGGEDKFINDGDPYSKQSQSASVGAGEVRAERERLDKLGITSPKKRQKGGYDDGFINDGDPYRHKKNKHKMPVNLNLTNYKSDKHDAFKYKEKSKDKSKDKTRDKEKGQDRDKDRSNGERKRDKDDGEKSFKIPKVKKVNKVNNAPPPMSFKDLLKVANQKKDILPADPKKAILEAKEKNKEEKKKRDKERPLNAEEKEVFEEDQRRRMKKLGIKDNNGMLRDALEKKSDSKSVSKSDSKSDSKSQTKHEIYSKSKPVPKPEPPPPPPKPDRSKYFAVPSHKKTQPPPEPPKKIKDKIQDKDRSRDSQQKVQDKDRSRDSQQKVQDKDRSRDYPKKSSKVPQSKSSKDYSSRDSSNARDTSRLFPPSDVRRKQPTNGRNRIESDEDSEIDSEMDDFIDDEEGELDYRSEIAKMFGIDREKWRKIDEEDIGDMEVGYSQLQREERISEKIGLMEDMEDMKSEEKYRKQKLARKKMAGKTRR